MSTELENYIRQRARKIGISLSRLCSAAGISRQTLYESWRADRYPSLNTLMAIASVLRIHPMRLLQIVFSNEQLEHGPSPVVEGDRSAFVDDVTVPDGFAVLANSRFRKTWALQNVGTIPWEGRRLVCQDEELVVFSRKGEELHLAPNLIPDSPFIEIPDTAPGDTVELSMEFTAPTLPGTMLSYWKMALADGGLCFPDARGLWVKVLVVTPSQVAGGHLSWGDE